MGRWNKSPEDVLFGYEPELWDRYPRHVVQAFFAVNYDDVIPITEGDGYDQVEEVTKAIEAFAQRWGGLSDEVLVYALVQAEDRDRLTAMFAIGHSTLPDAADLLVPWLVSSNVLERCAAAIVLGLRHDERVFPVLEDYLLIDMPTVEIEDPRTGKNIQRVQPEAEGWFNSYRRYIAGVCATIGPASLTAVLRDAFLKHWKRKRQNAWSKDYSFTDSLLYALGRRGALDILGGMDMPDFHRRLSTIFLVLGALRADERFEDMDREMCVKSELQQEVASFCTLHLGLSKQEAEQHVNFYLFDSLKRRERTLTVNGQQMNIL